MNYPSMIFGWLVAGTTMVPVSGTVMAVVAPAGVGADAVLSEVDRRAAPFDDQSYEATMEIVKSDQVVKTLRFRAVMKGLDRQLLEFTAPGDVAGMKVLMMDAHNLYLYSKEFGKVRKVAAHAVKQGFMGSEFTFEDMTQIELSPSYSAAMGPKEGEVTTLILTRKAGAEASFPKLEISIDKTRQGVTAIRYFDDAGQVVREQQRDEWARIAGHQVPTRVTMINRKTGHRTVIRLSNIKVNQGVDDAMFSRRQLLRG